MKLILLTAALLFLPGIAFAAGPQRLTWERSVREAERNNPDLAAARESVNKARAQYQGNYGPQLPQLSADGGYTDSKTAGSSRSQEYSASLSAKQTIFSGLKNEANVRKSKADLEAAEANLTVVKAQVSSDLKNAFADLLYAEEQAQLVETISGRRQENVRMVELRYEGGTEPKGSYLRSRAQYLQADFEVSQAERALRVGQRELARVLGRSELERLFVGGLGVVPPSGLPNFRALALETPVRLQAAALARSAHEGVAVARSELFPDVSLAGSVSRQGSNWPPNRDAWSAGVVFSYPFWTGGQNLFDVKGAKAEERRTKQVLRSTEDQTVLDLEQTFAAFQDAAQKVGVQREFLSAAQVRAEIARGQYSLGLLSFQDWDIIENDLISNQKTMLSNLRDALLAEAAWERVQGKGAIP